jgi:hypothetical protein
MAISTPPFFHDEPVNYSLTGCRIFRKSITGTKTMRAGRFVLFIVTTIISRKNEAFKGFSRLFEENFRPFSGH